MRRSKTPRRLALSAALCLPLLLCGCLDYEEVITLSAAGGGSAEATATLDVSLLRELSQALGEELEPGELASPSRAEVEEMLAVEGVTVRELEVEQGEGGTRIHAKVDFADLEALRRIEGFGARRRVELYDRGAGRVLLASFFDPRDVVPFPGFGAERADGSPLEPQERERLDAVVGRLRRALRLKSELRLPGPILASNGDPEVAPAGPNELAAFGRAAPGGRLLDASGVAERSSVSAPANACAWAVDAERSPERHADLGRNEVVMKAVCDASTLPWARDLPPAPEELGGVGDDALAGVASSSTTAPAATAAEAPAAPTSGERGRAGCSLRAGPDAGASSALTWALLVCSLLLARRRGAQGAA
ncbi:MAG: hypothetical protein AB7N76_29115 [Planctomycetota bacterium]